MWCEFVTSVYGFVTQFRNTIVEPPCDEMANLVLRSPGAGSTVGEDFYVTCNATRPGRVWHAEVVFDRTTAVKPPP